MESCSQEGKGRKGKRGYQDVQKRETSGPYITWIRRIPTNANWGNEERVEGKKI